MKKYQHVFGSLRECAARGVNCVCSSFVSLRLCWHFVNDFWIRSLTLQTCDMHWGAKAAPLKIVWTERLCSLPAVWPLLRTDTDIGNTFLSLGVAESFCRHAAMKNACDNCRRLCVELCETDPCLAKCEPIPQLCARCYVFVASMRMWRNISSLTKPWAWINANT